MAENQSNQFENTEIVEELRELKDILTVAQVVVSSLDLDEVLQNILISAMAIMEIPAGSIALFDEETSRLELHAHAGLSEAFTNKQRWLVKAGGLTHEILERGELFVIEDTNEADFFNNPLALNEGIRSLIAVPLKIQDKIVGVLYVDDFVPREYPESRLRILNILGSFASMSIDNARLHEQTQELACTDGLTGLYNHRQFKILFKEEIARARRYNKKLGVVMFDIDNFKHFNDTYGHPNGDQVLTVISKILKETLRDSDISFRYGGEEFIVLLPEVGITQTLKAARRILDAVNSDSQRALSAICDHGITISAGAASFPRDGENETDLLKVVDDMLYKAKALGKNRVCYVQGC
ncbi:MAG: GGDEF domain-containing protein [Desulfuromonas sp.]|nr:MAG: GGDEF domain-containing protein [Desulfuromonas sp.]